MGRWLAGLALAFGLVGATFVAPASAAPKFPALTGQVVDEAGLLSPSSEADLTGKLQALEDKTGRQLVVVTLPSLQGYEIEEFGYQLGRAWGIGSKQRNDGVLLIVAPNERKVRVEVGYGLEGVLTDALSSVILQTRVLPKFKAGQMEAGVVDGADALIEQLSLPDDEARARVAKAAATPKSQDGGGLPPIAVFVIMIVIFFMLSRFGRRRGLGGVLPWIIMGALNNRDRGGWGGGGGGWGGGGFSGGGGSFGGGGSSGSW